MDKWFKAVMILTVIGFSIATFGAVGIILK